MKNYFVTLMACVFLISLTASAEAQILYRPGNDPAVTRFSFEAGVGILDGLPINGNPDFAFRAKGRIRLSGLHFAASISEQNFLKEIGRDPNTRIMQYEKAGVHRNATVELGVVTPVPGLAIGGILTVHDKDYLNNDPNLEVGQEYFGAFIEAIVGSRAGRVMTEWRFEYSAPMEIFPSQYSQELRNTLPPHLLRASLNATSKLFNAGEYAAVGIFADVSYGNTGKALNVETNFNLLVEVGFKYYLLTTRVNDSYGSGCPATPNRTN